MKTLILMRHAKSDRPEGVEDFDRPLTEGGRADAARVGAWLRTAGHIPQKALVSAAQRTRETWEALDLEGEAPVKLLKEFYDASPAQILGILGRVEANTVLVVGHNPAVEALAIHLLRDADVPADLAAWKPSTCAVIAFDVADWAEAGKEPGRLKGFATRNSLSADAAT